MSEYSSTGDQMLIVLEQVAKNGPLSAALVAEACSINRTITHRLLNTLIKKRYTLKTSRGYILGPAAFDLARSAIPGVVSAARDGMEKLALEIDETVILHCISDNEAVALDQVLSQNRLIMVRHTPGSRHPLNRGASGWALLAFQNDKFIQKYLNSLSKSEHTKTKIRISNVKSSGFAISEDELQLGVHGLFVPVINPDQTCDYSLGILVPAIRHNGLQEFAPRLKRLSVEITQNIQDI